MVDHVETKVVRSELVFTPRIPQANDEKLGLTRHLIGPQSPAHDRCLFLLLLVRALFLFFLTLLDDFRLGCSRRSAFRRRSGGLSLSLQGDYVRDDRLRRTHQFNRATENQVACAYALADHQLADVDLKMLRNVVRQTLDFNLSSNQFMQTAL